MSWHGRNFSMATQPVSKKDQRQYLKLMKVALKEGNRFWNKVRSVYASQTHGEGSLVNFGNLMDLLLPVNKKSYQNRQNKLDSVLTHPVEIEMIDAALRLAELT